MSVKIGTRFVGDVLIVDLPERITLGEGSSVLRDIIRDAVGKKYIRIILNLEGVWLVDSSGIGELVSGYTIVDNAGGKLKLLNLGKRVRDLLEITKLIALFEVHGDEPAAIRSFTQ